MQNLILLSVYIIAAFNLPCVENSFLLPNIVSTKDLLKNREYHSKPSSEFIINERGKVRPITGLQMSDRVIRHSLCDNVLSP